ncbi:MarR family winged helix-turn-helix transcriptional regulator [Streptomyces sp. NPDC058892]|uniref:MarR family winged helix-turn-helix transcriptional regulator n=1 Tax=unclassified Streptomyces TaxID=2593676 RepID=UPI00044B754C|nr:hypothetical protein [Streptomyces sp. PCS3-D2]WKV75322.1 MarR family transcriptional regulator [Streptomyces sp. PCS3-D2]
MEPIGYWLNRTDQALTAAMNALLADCGLTRLAWQVLNVVEDAPRSTDEAVRTVLAANAGTEALTTTIEALLSGGWMMRTEPGRLALTDEGHARLTDVGLRVGDFRERSIAGISPEEYRAAVSVLERMTRNVEQA